jgi:hypothetical protein
MNVKEVGNRADDRHDQPDTLVPDPVVWKEFGVTSMTGWRWTQDPDLGFPAQIKIRTRSFRSRKGIEEFKGRMVARSLAARNRDAG